MEGSRSLEDTELSGFAVFIDNLNVVRGVVRVGEV